jgi:predicted ATPase
MRTNMAATLNAIGKEAGISDQKILGSSLTRIGRYVVQHLESWRIYHFHDTSPFSALRKTSDLNDNRSFRMDGSNLAAFLYLLRIKHESNYRMIRSTIQSVAPFFDDFVLEPLKLSPDKIRLEWLHKGSDAHFDVSTLSDGTLRFIALSALFLQPQQLLPSVILVDEPELGLHPSAIAMLGSLIKQAATFTQVIVSTQSSLLLDQFLPENILVAERVNGGTQFHPLDSEKLASWLEDYSLGQLWEKNEFGGRPKGI